MTKFFLSGLENLTATTTTKAPFMVQKKAAKSLAMLCRVKKKLHFDTSDSKVGFSLTGDPAVLHQAGSK